MSDMKCHKVHVKTFAIQTRQNKEQMHIGKKDNGCQQACELMRLYGTGPQCDEQHEGIIKKWG